MKALILVMFQSSLFANDCPKWAPIVMDDILITIPIYNGNNTDTDTDCDGVSDAEERRNGTNPLKSDTDGDGVDDYQDDYPLNPNKSEDKTAPVITLRGTSTLTLYRYNTYTEAGATARDDRDGTVSVRIVGSVNTSVPKTYRITYHAVDAKGNKSTKIRTITVKPEVRPQIVVDTHSTVDAGGHRPSHVVQEFIEAFLANDRDRVSELVGENQQLLAMLYSNPDATAFLKTLYGKTGSIKGSHHTMGSTVTITFIDKNKSHKGGFELVFSTHNGDSSWVITFIY